VFRRWPIAAAHQIAMLGVPAAAEADRPELVLVRADASAREHPGCRFGAGRVGAMPNESIIALRSGNA
jgi:hypothetical protein